ncbi:hypothetical protein [Larkinella knui]|uniref:Uncharacterized protein n=1 Tax=Larkinella knui TaxID=2025310 RepID=A0A3P1CDK2_9BACT|nr:hypothetical protein [Larkinella knui]RRB11389.1 hypothetical protein EHT87_23165 [Larkinella knui]
MEENRGLMQESARKSCRTETIKMKPEPAQNYLRNCFLLMLPILVWNLALANQLPTAFRPEVFWNDIPIWLAYGENGSRTLVFALTLIMPLRFSDRTRKNGRYLYLAGLLIYAASWIALIYFPDSPWSTSLPGFMAPAYTPFFWLAGIGLIGHSFYFNLPFRPWFFFSVSLLFLSFHCFHTATIYYRIH